MKTKKNSSRPNSRVELPEDDKQDLIRIFDGMIYLAEERIKQIELTYSQIEKKIQSSEITVKFENVYKYSDHPTEVPRVLWPSEIFNRHRKFSSRFRVAKLLYLHGGTIWSKDSGLISAAKYLLTKRKATTAKVRGSIGDYYKKISHDPTISEAFDSGFYVCVKLLQDGFISLNQIAKDKKDYDIS